MRRTSLVGLFTSTCPGRLGLNGRPSSDTIRTRACGTGASAVGESTTRAVVAGIILIILSDGLFAVVFYFLGI